MILYPKSFFKTEREREKEERREGREIEFFSPNPENRGTPGKEDKKKKKEQKKIKTEKRERVDKERNGDGRERDYRDMISLLQRERERNGKWVYKDSYFLKSAQQIHAGSRKASLLLLLCSTQSLRWQSLSKFKEKKKKKPTLFRTPEDSKFRQFPSS